MTFKTLLGGMMPQQPSQMNTLLGIDPRAARWNAVGNFLQGAGVGLATGDWGQGLEASQAGQQQFQQNALIGNRLQQQADDQDYSRNQDAMQWDWRKQQAAQEQANADRNYALAQQRMAQSQSGGGNEYGLNPVWARDAQGNWQLFQPSKGGGAPAQVQFPPGVAPQPQVSFQDLGTGIQPMTNRGAIPIGAPIPKDLAGAESQKAQGEASGKAIAAAPLDIQAADNALDLIQKIKTDPYLERGTGLSSYGNVIPGTGGYDFQNLVKQAKSGAFLTAIQQMRGLGSLSVSEGDAATAAVNRMNTATSKEAFLSATDDYEKIIRQGRARAAARLSQPGAVATPQPIKTEDGYTIEPVQ